jgi:hypothetical protein
LLPYLAPPLAAASFQMNSSAPVGVNFT